jgi:hypothetical protein
LLARAAQNGVSMFVSVYRAATARERSFRDVPPETVYAPALPGLNPAHSSRGRT